jgi:AraC-like DNA-binding protein
LCRAVRADPELSFLPVIMVTARASRQSRLSSLEEGADDYLVKPFDPRELRLRVANLLAARRRLAERLREEGASLPFIPLDLPHDASHRDFATRLTEILREHMEDEDFGVDDLARALAMSRSTLYRQADDALGTSPMDLLWGFRLEQAAHWLRETDATVSEVAYACGFKTVPHFTRKFKARFGTTPAAYRRREE